MDLPAGGQKKNDFPLGVRGAGATSQEDLPLRASPKTGLMPLVLRPHGGTVPLVVNDDISQHARFGKMNEGIPLVDKDMRACSNHDRLAKPLSARICAAGIAANLKYIFEWKSIVLVVATAHSAGLEPARPAAGSGGLSPA